MSVPLLLLKTLEDLNQEDFKCFKWYLCTDVLDGCDLIPRCHLGEDVSRPDTVSVMMRQYGKEMSVNVAVDVLKQMSNNNAAKTLETRYAAGRSTAAPSTSTSAAAPPAAPVAPPPAPVAPPAAPVAPPAAPATIMAQGNSISIAPTFTGGTSGALNITINK